MSGLGYRRKGTEQGIMGNSIYVVERSITDNGVIMTGERDTET